MGNPFTEWIKSGMESADNRHERMKQRVAYNAIYSEQVRDERAMPSKVENWWQVQRQSSGNPNMKFYNAHSAFKNKKEGRANSFEAHTYYNDQAKAKREAMLAEIANES